jgi:hypothetical protein
LITYINKTKEFSMRNLTIFSTGAAALAIFVASSALAQTAARTTKDIVLDRISMPIEQPTSSPVAMTAAMSDVMAVSVLVESADGSLTARSTQNLFKTGERFRVKVLAGRDGTLEFYNTNPRGQTTKVWEGQVKAGLETVSPRLRLEGNSGEDQLHIVLTPATPPSAGILDWVSGFLKKTTKDIRLDVQSTATSTYVVNTAGQGALSTIRIVHN